MGKSTPPPGRTPRSRRGEVTAKPSAPEMIIAAQPSPEERRTVTGMLLRFISCGLLALWFGIVWRLTLAPAVVGPGTAFAGIFALLLGFMLGGILWYLRDVRRRRRDPQAIPDERLVFSFVVFAVMPFAVLLLVGAVWLLAFFIGGA
jgi:hypothetical protein